MWARALVISLLVSAAPFTVEAQDPDAEAARCLEFGTDDVDVTARIADIRARVELHESDSRHWWTAWASIFAGLTGVELTLALTASQDGPRIDAIVSTISLALGLATQIFAFPPLIGVGGQMDAMPESTPDERVAKLIEAERMLRRSAEAVRFSRGPVGPILSGLYSIAANTVLIAGFGRTVGAFIGVLGGIVLGQGRIITQPYGIDREWRIYEAAHPDAGCTAASAVVQVSVPVDLRVLPTATLGGGGLSLSMTF